MRKILLLAATGLFLGVGAMGAQAQNILDRDVATQRAIATQHSPLGVPDAASQLIEGRAAFTGGNAYGQPYEAQPNVDSNNYKALPTGR